MNTNGEELVIMKSARLRHFQTSSVIIVAIFLVLLTFMLMTGTRMIAGLDMGTAGWIARILIIGIAISAVYATETRGKHKRYTFRDNTMTVSDRSHGQDRVEKMVNYTPDSVKSMTIQQSGLDKMLDVGTIALSIAGPGSVVTYHIVGVDQPNEVVSKLNTFMRS